jgi:hypothetical protein
MSRTPVDRKSPDTLSDALPADGYGTRIRCLLRRACAMGWWAVRRVRSATARPTLDRPQVEADTDKPAGTGADIRITPPAVVRPRAGRADAVWHGQTVMLHHRADGTVEATTRGRVAYGRSEAEALDGLARLLRGCTTGG